MAQPFPGFLNSFNSARNAACLAYHAASREPVTSVWTGARLRTTSTWIFLWVGWIIYCRSGCSILNRHHNCCYQAFTQLCAICSPFSESTSEMGIFRQLSIYEEIVRVLCPENQCESSC